MGIKTLLVVDDEEKNIKLIKLPLKSEDYRLFGAPNGRECLEMVANISPDLILLDIMMPGIDGYETCRRLKQDEKTRMIPVLIVTALSEKQRLVKAMESGADDFLSKPVDKIELLVRVKSLLRIKSYHDDLLEREAKYKKVAIELQEAIVKVKTLSGMLPICSNCKKIRDDEGYWNEIESYINKHSEAEFTHSICPKCVKKLYPDLKLYDAQE